MSRFAPFVRLIDFQTFETRFMTELQEVQASLRAWRSDQPASKFFCLFSWRLLSVTHLSYSQDYTYSNKNTNAVAVPSQLTQPSDACIKLLKIDLLIEISTLTAILSDRKSILSLPVKWKVLLAMRLHLLRGFVT